MLYASTAAQETLVRPRLKSDPDEGEHTTVLPGMLSVTFTGNTTFADDVFARVPARSVVGQASVGGSLSSTVTSNEHVALFAAAFETTHTTVVVPSEKAVDRLAEHSTRVTRTLSESVTSEVS